MIFVGTSLGSKNHSKNRSRHRGPILSQLEGKDFSFRQSLLLRAKDTYTARCTGNKHEIISKWLLGLAVVLSRPNWQILAKKGTLTSAPQFLLQRHYRQGYPASLTDKAKLLAYVLPWRHPRRSRSERHHAHPSRSERHQAHTGPEVREVRAMKPTKVQKWPTHRSRSKRMPFVHCGQRLSFAWFLLGLFKRRRMLFALWLTLCRNLLFGHALECKNCS